MYFWQIAQHVLNAFYRMIRIHIRIRIVILSACLACTYVIF
jgi:hypothetical protein